MAFSTDVSIFSVFLLPISIRIRYRDHLVANRMAPSMCPDTCETRWGSWFQAIPYHYSRRIFGVYAVRIFKKMLHKTDVPNCKVLVDWYLSGGDCGRRPLQALRPVPNPDASRQWCFHAGPGQPPKLWLGPKLGLGSQM